MTYGKNGHLYMLYFPLIYPPTPFQLRASVDFPKPACLGDAGVCAAYRWICVCVCGATHCYVIVGL